jgi:hypothetical protein
MRLLRRKSGDDFELVTFNTYDLPPYAILSHTWTDDEEVTYDELVAGTGKHKAGYEKIRLCGEQATADNLLYFWVDTCCIDKSSSSELAEAINSMYQWYKRAWVCYAYLSDVTSTGLEFSQSRWFSRGWTLQELIAPSSLKFFGRSWCPLGTKSSHLSRVYEITGVHYAVLYNREPAMCSVSQRMSWAAKRETSRLEDKAYCLMGLFDVNMPLLYGEGDKAFIRLQQEIMKDSDDHSLFAWKVPAVEDTAESGLLARTPSHFIDTHNFTPLINGGSSAPYAMTNKGLSLDVRIHKSMSLTRLEVGEEFPVMLNCCKQSIINKRAIIYLKCLSKVHQ